MNAPGFGGSRRRALAAATTALAAVALAAAVAGRGCGPQDDTPDGAVRAFDAAARAGDKRAVYELLGPETQSTLAERADRASALGEDRYAPEDMIGLGETTTAPTPTLEVVREKDGSAVVAITGDGGQRSTLNLVKIKGHWRVELEL